MGDLTPEENAVWVRFTQEEADLDAHLDRVAADIAAGTDHPLHGDDGEDELYCVEVVASEQEFREAYESWWAWRAGNGTAWNAALEEVLSDLIFAIGMSFYGDEEEE